MALELNGIWAVNAPSDITAVLDVSGNQGFKAEVGADGRIGTAFGLPVNVQDMATKGNVVLMDSKAYAVSISGN